ncbi:MAG: hypothetical protein ACREL1_00525 [bacterium]
MKKGLWMLLAGLMTIGTSVSAFASARLDSMGADARQVGDIDLIWLYPNMVTDYKNTVDFRLFPYGNQGDAVNEWGGALVDAQDLGVFGVYVNRPTDEYSNIYRLWGSGPVRPTLRYSEGQVGNLPWLMAEAVNYAFDYNNQVDLFWGKKFGDSSFGLHFNYGAGQNTNIGGGLTTDEVYSLDAGLGLNNVGPFGTLNIHAGYAIEGMTRGTDKDSGIYTAKLGALAISDLDADNSLHLFADAQMDGFKFDNTYNAANVDYSDWALDLGASVNRKIDGGKGLFSTGVILDYIAGSSPSDSADFNINEWNLVWNASLEAPVSDWLTLRTGLSKLIVARVYDRTNFYGDGTGYDNTSANSNLGADNVKFSTGFGITWQNFTLNASVDAASLEDSINNVQPGNGILFAGTILTVETADLSYKF